MPPSEAAPAARDLEERFVERLSRNPVRWDMIVYLGERADTTDNASMAWPEDRRQLKAGTLTITQAVPYSAECAAMRFDPLVLADGIAASDDPMLLLRSPTYRLALSEILAEAQASPPERAQGPTAVR